MNELLLGLGGQGPDDAPCIIRSSSILLSGPWLPEALFSVELGAFHLFCVKARFPSVQNRKRMNGVCSRGYACSSLVRFYLQPLTASNASIFPKLFFLTHLTLIRRISNLLALVTLKLRRRNI